MYFSVPADAICKDTRAFFFFFLWVPRYGVIAVAAHLAGLRRQSKFTGAAAGATAGAAPCARRICAELIFIHLVLDRRHATQTGILCLLNLQQHRSDMFGGGGVLTRPCTRVRVYPT